VISDLAQVPKGWRKVKFGEIANNITDRIDNPKESGLQTYIGLEHLDTDEIRIKRYGSPDEVEATKFLCKKGDIIFGKRRAYLRKLAVTEKDAVVSAHSMVLRAKTGKVLLEFLPWFMQSAQFWKTAFAISEGSLSPTIKWKTLSSQEFWLPSEIEQKRVAGLLWGIENHIEKTEGLIQAAERLKEGLLKELLTIGIGHTEFKKTEIGEIPKEWDLVELGCVLKPNFGLRITQKNDAGEKYPVYGGGGISFHTDSFSREDEFVISRFAMSEECVRYVKEKFYMLDSGFTIEATDEVPKEYLGIFLTINQDMIYSCGRGPAQKNLDINQFLRIPFPKPIKNEAEKIIQIYNNFTKMENELNTNKRNLHLLKKKLTNSFLSGDSPMPKEVAN
jgi:type I restriction enzyme, S subunit